MQISLPYVNLAYPVTKSPPPLQFHRSRRDTIAPSEECTPLFDRLLDDGITRDSVSCYKETEVDRGWRNTTSAWCQMHN